MSLEPGLLKETSVDHQRFDALTQRIARQTSRRTTLAALVGGALLLQAPTASEANKKAKRRRKQRRRVKARSIKLKPISILVDNTGGDRAARVEHGVHFRTRNRCCNQLATVSVPAGESRMFNTSLTDAYVWIDDKFWFGFSNDFLLPPSFSAAVDGRASGGGCCKQVGQTVVSDKSMSVNQVVFVPMAGQTFTVRRNRDTNYKSFTVFLPAVQ